MVKFIALVFATQAFAGYRVYQLKVTHYDISGKPIRSETILSNLDQFQYEHYYAGYRWDRVELKDTWYCPGDTSHHQYCKKPRGPVEPITDLLNKRGYLPTNRQPVIP